MPKEYHINSISASWKLPFNLALLFHIVLLSSAIVLPKYINTRPKLPEFTSVDLINIADILPLPAAPATQSSPPAKLTKPPIAKIQKSTTFKAKKVIPIIAPIVAETAQAPIAKAISIKPSKRKLKKNLPTIDKSAQDRQKQLEAEQNRKLIARQQALEAESRQLQEEAKRQEEIANAEAKLAATAALNALKQSLRADEASAATRNGQRDSSRRSGGTSSALEAQYFSSIFSHLHQYWAFPVSKQEDLELSAVVVINIAQNGQIIGYNFEKRSGDRVFDQFVNRALQEANPLPAIPRALKEQQYTLGLRFKPGQIQ